MIRGWSISEAGLEPGDDIVLGSGAGYTIYLLTSFDKDERGDVLHAVTSGERTGLIDIDLADFGYPRHLRCHLVNDGGDHAAGTAPCCPEVDQNRNGGIEDFSLEVAFCNL